MISKSPCGEEFRYTINPSEEAARIEDFVNNGNKRKTVVIQGLGFVGSAMAAALSGAKDKNSDLIFNVLGVDLPDAKNYWKIARANLGKPPCVSSDRNMDTAYKNVIKNKNLIATYAESAYAKADVVIVDVHLDIKKKELGNPYNYDFTYDAFKKALEKVANNVLEDTLVVLETTVPPGTTEKIVYPIFEEAFKRRKLNVNKLYLVYSYERVMPGRNYLDSIINFYRVYSGINKTSKMKAEKFFKSFINTKDYPLYEMHSPTAAEMAKVLENSFRVANIAFIQEWTEYAERAGVNLFDAVEAIRMRPTHKNIMFPGFGVGGYCLPKDPLFAHWSSNNLFDKKAHFEMSLKAMATNDLMPRHTLALLRQRIADLNGKKITILGVSYLNDVADTRCSPTEHFYDKCLEEGATINIHDPFVCFWKEKNIKIDTNIKSLKNKVHDIAIFTVRHGSYLDLKVEDIFSFLPGVKVIVDANNIISDDTARKLSEKGIDMIGVGKGHWRYLRTNDE